MVLQESYSKSPPEAEVKCQREEMTRGTRVGVSPGVVLRPPASASFVGISTNTDPWVPL